MLRAEGLREFIVVPDRLPPEVDKQFVELSAADLRHDLNLLPAVQTTDHHPPVHRAI